MKRDQPAFPDLERWRGKVALVTGGSSGIGAALALALGEIGMRVAVAGRIRRRVQKVARAARARGGESLMIIGDQRRAAANHAFFRRLRRVWGGVDVLINCAATRGGDSVLGARWREIDDALNLNVRAALICMREAAADMRGKADAAIISISSLAGHRIAPDTPIVYAATKHMLRVLTEGIRSELKMEKIKVAMISPGRVDTPWLHRAMRRRGGVGAYPPMRTDDIVAAVRFILGARPGLQVRDIVLAPSGQPF